MKETILDLHIHSRYSRACSPELQLPQIARGCETRGIDIVVTGDFTHPRWFQHLEGMLVEEQPGIFAVKGSTSKTRFLLGTEVASIKKHAGETRRVHHLLFAPSLTSVKKFNETLAARGINLTADGRPIIGMTSHDILETMLAVDERMVMIPAHAWTPWFGVFGSKGGYTSLEECFEDLTPRIHAIETGLSSDPLMNWQWSALDNITLISNSDAHSVNKLGREANVFVFADDEDITYDEIMRIIANGDKEHFLYTVEFYPEEGKYHLDGHRLCQFVCTPAETKRLQGICPKCRKPLTIGVMHRVADLADRTETEAKQLRKIPYRSLVPLPEIIADTLQVGVGSRAVAAMYKELTTKVGSEFYILLHAPIRAIETASRHDIARAVERVRLGKIAIEPGYDGQFGVVKVFKEGEAGRVAQASLTLD